VCRHSVVASRHSAAATRRRLLATAEDVGERLPEEVVGEAVDHRVDGTVGVAENREQVDGVDFPAL